MSVPRFAVGRYLPDSLLPLLVACIALAYSWWTFSDDHFFFADDWHWLRSAAFWPWDFSVFPRAVYNDRPVGADLIKLMYRLFGLEFAGYAGSLLFLHVLNCLLLYTFVRRYLSTTASFIAAALAAIWASAISAATWLAAIFDLFGATLILLMLVSQQHADRTGKWWPTLASLLFYILAVRTKEFAIGGAALIFLMEYLCEKKDLRASIRTVAPFLIVFSIYAGFYLYYVLKTGTAEFGVTKASHVYALDLNPVGVLANLWFYFSTLFFATIVGPVGIIAILFALVVGVWTLPDALRQIVYFACAGFVLMLGPTLGLSLHRTGLYLYTSHFFAAMAVGALCNDWKKQPAAFVIGLALCVVVVSTPFVTSARTYHINFALKKGAKGKAQFATALRLLGPTLPPNTLVVISGVDKFFNPFSSGPGNSLKIAYQDRSIQTEIEKPDQTLMEIFCQAEGRPRRYIVFEGVEAKDMTGPMERSCAENTSGRQ